MMKFQAAQAAQQRDGSLNHGARPSFIFIAQDGKLLASFRSFDKKMQMSAQRRARPGGGEHLRRA
jgi:hypothetical protein